MAESGTVRMGALAIAFSFLIFSGCLGVDDDGAGAGSELLFTSGAAEDGAADVIGSPARIWRTEASLFPCSHWDISEDFSSGSYNVHRYRTTIPRGGAATIRLVALAGSWSPAVLVSDGSGAPIFEGESPGSHLRVTASPVLSGRHGAAAEVLLEAEVATEANIYVTSWEVLSSGLEGTIPRDARYSLDVRHECDSAGSGSWASVFHGITQHDVPIPRAGVWNETLRAVYGDGDERYGELVGYDGAPFVAGRVSWFGGPNDRGVSATETGAISGERLRELNVPLDPSAAELARRPEDFYFVAMRFDYGPAGISFWRNARLLVLNPETGAAAVVRAVDWGPGISTRRIVDVSPQIMDELGLTTDDDLFVAFATSASPLGRLW